MQDSLKEFVEVLEKEINRQLERAPLSMQDNLVKCAYATAYEKVKVTLENVLNGKKYCDCEE